jgi:hypothetical protein
MTTTRQPVGARAALEFERSGENRRWTNLERATTVDLAADGAIAVVRPGVPRLARVLLALTGVKV